MTTRNEENITSRDQYNALNCVPQWCATMMKKAQKAGCWTTGIESDKRQRGSAINCDLYGYDAKKQLAVVQVRETVFRPGRYTRVRKDYYLIGHNENGSFFAHCCASPSRSKKALETPESTVAFVLSKIWNCTVDQLAEVVRQGDVAFIPVYRLPKTAKKLSDSKVTIRDSHIVTGEMWRDAEGTLYTRRGSRMTHSKRQHATVKAKYGFYRIQAGIRSEAWGFSAPTAD